MAKTFIASSLLLLCLLGCDGSTMQQQPMVSMQITEYKDAAAFSRVIESLRQRDITATILVNDTFAADNCDLLRQLDAEGFEIMAFARPTNQDGSSTVMSQLTYEQQLAFVSQIKAGIEACLVRPIDGFRSTRFDQNEDTYRVVQELNFDYNLGFVAQTPENLPGHEDAILPYYSNEYEFWAVPMHVAPYQGGLKTFCDNPWSDVSAEQWEAALISELDRMDTEDRPLLVEFHPYFTGTDEGRFEAFESFLDYAVQKGVRFISAEEYVRWSQDAEAGKGSSGEWTPCPWD